MNIFVGNLSFSTTDDSLRTLFEAHGEVSSAKVITSRDTGRSRGFGFVEMSDDGEGRAAVEALNGSDLDGRPLRVDKAQERSDRGGGGGGGRGGGGGGGGRRDSW